MSGIYAWDRRVDDMKRFDIGFLVALAIVVITIGIVIAYVVFVMSRSDMTLWQKLMLLKG